jgi:2-aminoadipate transaminase
MTDYIQNLLADRAAKVGQPFSMVMPENMIAFVYGLPDNGAFPADEIAEITAKVMQDNPIESLRYGSAVGLAEWLVEKVAKEQAMPGLSPANFLITVGSSQAIDLICRLLIDNGDYIVVEAPTFLGALRTFRQAGAQVAEAAMDDEGLDIADLERVISGLKAEGKRVKFIYTIPTFQNPTGRTMGAERRRELLEVAARHEVIVVEDDAYHGLLYEGEVPPWVWAMDDKGIVLHTGTFSKTLAPGMRLGWVGGAKELIVKMAGLKEDGDTSPFAGYIASRYAFEGGLELHIKKLVDLYKRKRDRMLAALERYMPDGARWTNPQGGFFIWVELPESIDTAKILSKASEIGVNYLPGSACFASGRGKNSLRLAFSYVPLEQIEPGIRKLGEIFAQEINR